MKTAIKIGLLGTVSASLFLGSYVGFARVVGADMSRLVVVGSFFQPPSEDDRETPETAERPPEEPAGPSLSESMAEQLRTPQRAASIIDFFTVQAPFSSDELKQVSDELLESADRLTIRERALDQREERLDERARKLDEDFATLTRLQTGLDEWASELRQRELELDRDADIKLEDEARVHAKIGELFARGDAEELVERLTMFAPEEAAKILATLTPKRANELLAAMEQDDAWLAYAEAYAARSADSSSGR